MSQLQNNIGPAYFVALRGTWQPPTEQATIEERPGLDGSEFTKTGQRGSVFQMLSEVDMPVYQSHGLFLKNYQSLILTEPLDVIQGGVSFANTFDGAKCVVLDVRLAAPPRAIRSPAGFVLNPPSLGWLTCVWTLKAVPAAEA